MARRGTGATDRPESEDKPGDDPRVEPNQPAADDRPPIESESDHADQLEIASLPPATERPADDATAAPKPKRKYVRRVKPADKTATPAEDKALLAAAFDGTFTALSLALGEHWRLNPARVEDGKSVPAESAILAEAWLPVFERYGGKVAAESVMWLSASTVTIAVIAPRVAVSVKRESGLIGWIKRKIAERRAGRRKAA